MEDTGKRIEELLEKPYWLIDIFPKRIGSKNADIYFRTEEYYQEKKRSQCIRKRFLEFLLRLNCYHRFVILDAETEKEVSDPGPEELEECFLGQWERPKTFCFLFQEKESMICFRTAFTSAAL